MDMKIDIGHGILLILCKVDSTVGIICTACSKMG